MSAPATREMREWWPRISLRSALATKHRPVPHRREIGNALHYIGFWNFSANSSTGPVGVRVVKSCLSSA